MSRQLFAAIVIAWPFVLSSASLRTPTFDLNESLLYLRFSQVSFCTPDSIRSFDCGDMCEAISGMDRKPLTNSIDVFGPGGISGVRGLTAVLPDSVPGVKVCVVAFRGSVNWKNWLTDANALHKAFPTAGIAAAWNYTSCPGCKIHRGFAYAYDELKSEMEWQLKKQGCTELHITGHSLGAGIATVAGMDLRASGWQVPKLWLYGSPRVGNDAFVKVFVKIALDQGLDQPAWRVVHYHDPVPHLAPAPLYAHLPGEVYFPDRASVLPPVVCPWDPSNLSESNSSCETWYHTVVDFADGLVKVDHANYMNLTFGHKYMNEKCQSLHARRLMRGLPTDNAADGWMVALLLLGFVLSVFGTVSGKLGFSNDKSILWAMQLLIRAAGSARQRLYDRSCFAAPDLKSQHSRS